MSEVWRGPAWTVPFLHFGAWRHILIPVQGRDIPFTVENYPYVDRLGRESITFVRTFEVDGPKRVRFDATMALNPQTHQIVDYLGSHQHRATDLSLEVTTDGGLTIRSHQQRSTRGRSPSASPRPSPGPRCCTNGSTTTPNASRSRSG